MARYGLRHPASSSQATTLDHDPLHIREEKLMKRFPVNYITLFLLAASTSVTAGVPMPRPNPADQGTYTLLSEIRRSDGVIETLHHRTGPAGDSWSWNEVRCASQEYREMASSYEGPDKPKGPPTRWTVVRSGTSKASLVSFVCTRRADRIPEIGKSATAR